MRAFRLFAVTVAIIIMVDSIAPRFVFPLRPIISYPVMIICVWGLMPLVIFVSILLRKWNGAIFSIAAMAIFAVVHVCSTLSFQFGSAPFKGGLLLVVWESPLHPTTYIALYGEIPLSTQIYYGETGVSPKEIYSQHMQLPNGIASVGDGVAFDARTGETYSLHQNWPFPPLK